MTGKMLLVSSLVMSILLALIPHILWVLCWLIGKCFHLQTNYSPFGWTAVGLVVLLQSVLAYGYYVGRWQLKTTQVTYKSKQVGEAFNGYKIVHISDLHLNSFDDQPERLQHITDEINKLEADLICFTGDLVTIGVREAEPYTTILSSLRAKDGVVSILGNHDFLIYNHTLRGQEREAEVERLTRYEREQLGWQLLRNQNKQIVRGEDTLTIVGVDNKKGDDQGFETINRGDLRQAMDGARGMTILLTHDPSHWQSEVIDQTTIGLTLSGHTHASQLKLFGWNPARLWFEQYEGRYEHNEQTLYINAGLGCTLPVRIACPAEITCIQLATNQ